MSNGSGAQLVFCNIPARDPQTLLEFYSALLGSGEFVQNQQSPIPQYQEAVTADGVDLTITQRQDTRDVTAVYWAVPKLSDMIGELQQQGGELVSQLTSSDGGESALMLDPEGNFVGLIQLAGDAHEYFLVGKFGAEADAALERRRKELHAASKRWRK